MVGYRHHVTEEPQPSFPVVFWNAPGAVWIIFITALVSFGSGSVLGLVSTASKQTINGLNISNHRAAQIPATLTDRYARLRYGYNKTTICHHHHSSHPHLLGGDNIADQCDLGSRDAESSAATANFISYGVSMVANPTVGAYSDKNGRRPILLLSLMLSCVPAITFVLLVSFPRMQPFWYYVSYTLDMI